MERSSEEKVDPFQALFNEWEQEISAYLQNNSLSTNTELFTILALVNAYVDNSFLTMEDCQRILGPPDPIDGGPPFKERMQPYVNLLNSNLDRVFFIHPVIAKKSVEMLAGLNISRSTMAKKCLLCLLVGQPKPEIIHIIKDMLIKREMSEMGKDKFSKLILDILRLENLHRAEQVLEKASSMLKNQYIFPQTIARLFYLEPPRQYDKAERWAKKAITIADNNSYVADTLGQVYKNKLMRTNDPEDVSAEAERAFEAFKNVEKKAEKEEGPEMNDMVGTVHFSSTFNNRGHFGFIEVAKIVSEKPGSVFRGKKTALKKEVEDKFGFFEWYLCYSAPDKRTVEPDYFWKDVVLCYEYYTEKKASNSTTFPGLLDSLNHGLFTSKGRRAKLMEVEKTQPALEETRDLLKIAYVENTDEVQIAERYILSNIILSNKMANVHQHAPVRELQQILLTFPLSDVQCRRPEFHLLVLLLFWPAEQLQVSQNNDDDKKMDQKVSEEEELQDENVHNSGDTTEASAEVEACQMRDIDLETHAVLMEKSFEEIGYAKYLRGRWLLPLFFLGKASSLSRWIHKSRLDKIVERKVDAELVNGQARTGEKMERMIDLWGSGQVWHVPEIKDILLPVQVEPSDEEQKPFVCVQGKKIKAYKEKVTEIPPQTPVLFYLAFNIRGPVVFKVGSLQEGTD